MEDAIPHLFHTGDGLPENKTRPGPTLQKGQTLRLLCILCATQTWNGKSDKNELHDEIKKNLQAKLISSITRKDLDNALQSIEQKKKKEIPQNVQQLLKEIKSAGSSFTR